MINTKEHYLANRNSKRIG